MVVVMFLGYNQFWPSGFMFCVVLCPGASECSPAVYCESLLLVTHIRTVFRTYSRKVLIEP